MPLTSNGWLYTYEKQVASNYFDGYDKLLDAFYEIGSCLPQFQDIANMYQCSGTIANYLALFYAEIIDFHYQAMRFFRRSGITSWMYRLLTAYADGPCVGWKMLLKSVWPKDTFGIIKQNIENHKGLIDREVKTQMIRESREEKYEALKKHQEERDEALKRYQAERDFRELDRLERNIPPQDYEPILNNVQSRHCAETGKWIFSDALFRSWLGAGNEAKQRLLWLAGVPGAGNLNLSAIISRVVANLYIGKTFLCYSILLHLQEMAQTNGSTQILYAFPSDGDNKGNTKAAIIRSLLYQLCRANPCLIPEVNKEHDARYSRSLLSNTCDKLLEKFICSSEPVYIILDGLDECDKVDREQLLRIILHLLKTCSNLHVLIASRKEVDICQTLKANCETLVVEEKNRADIKRFVTNEINSLWRKIRHIVDPTAGEFFKTVAHNIVNRSEGARSMCRKTL